MRSVEALLRDYRTAAVVHSEPNDGSKQWMRRVNRAADHMRHIARTLTQGGVGTQEALIGLLAEHEPDPVREWAAHHVLELIHARQDVEQRALEIIKAVAALDSVESIGERIWLRNWRASKSSGAEFIDAVCRMPLDLRNSNQSPVSLLRGAGYLRHGVAVRASDVADCLLRHPDLAEAWLAYSSDKRVEQGWYVTEVPDGGYRVGYYPAGVVLEFPDRIEAVAEFVVRELHSIGDNAG